MVILAMCPVSEFQKILGSNYALTRGDSEVSFERVITQGD